MKKTSRISFFKTVGLSSIGALFASSLPIKILAGEKKQIGKIKVNVHPAAISRKKAGKKNV